MPAFFVIAGPCVIESRELCLTVGSRVKSICEKLGLQYIFKASFDKANRSSNSTFRGPGLQDGLVILDAVKRELGVPVLTDIHESEQAAIADGSGLETGTAQLVGDQRRTVLIDDDPERHGSS